MNKHFKNIILFISSCAVIVTAIFTAFNFYKDQMIAQAFEQAVDVMQTLKTAHFKQNSTIDVIAKMKGQYQGISQETTMEMSGNGQVDLEKRQLSAEIKARAMNQSMTIIEVVDGNDIYFKVDDSPYIKHTVAEFEAEPMTQTTMTPESFKKQLIWNDLDKENSYQFMGEEEVDGIVAYKYKLTTDMDNYFHGFMDEMTQPLVEMYAQLGLNISQDDISFEMGDDIECYVWVSKEDRLPIKQYSYLDNFTLEIKDFVEISYQNMVVETSFDHINQAVEIEIPQL